MEISRRSRGDRLEPSQVMNILVGLGLPWLVSSAIEPVTMANHRTLEVMGLYQARHAHTCLIRKAVASLGRRLPH